MVAYGYEFSSRGWIGLKKKLYVLSGKNGILVAVTQIRVVIPVECKFASRLVPCWSPSIMVFLIVVVILYMRT